MPQQGPPQPQGAKPPSQTPPGAAPPGGPQQQPGGFQQQQGTAAQQPGTQPGVPGNGQRPQLNPITIEELIETDVVTAERDTPIQEIVAMMAQHDVGSVVILDDDTPVGIVTDRSIALALDETEEIAEQEADEITPDDLALGTTEMDLTEIVDRLTESDVRRLPIVDDDGALQGIVTLDDVLVFLGTELERATSVIEAQSPRL